MGVSVFLLLLVVLGAYTIFTGATPSVIRAALMGAVLLMGPVVGRRYDPTSALLLSGALMIGFDPDVLADGGFQLSFMATMGIIYIAPHFYTLLTKMRVPTLINLPIAASLGAQVAVVPLAALLTHQVSFVSLPATLTAGISLLPLMITGMAAGILGSLFEPLGELAGLLVWPCATWLLWWVELWGSLPWASTDLESVNSSLVALYYVALGGALWLIPTIGRMRVKPGKTVLGLGATAYLALLILATIFLNP
jgi:competence protein ComEC